MLDDLKEGYKAYKEGYEIRMEAYEARAQTSREFWANLPEEDKRALKKLLLGCFLIALGVIEIHARINPYWCF